MCVCGEMEGRREAEERRGWEEHNGSDVAFNFFLSFICCGQVNTSGNRNTEQDMDIPTSLY